MALFGCASDEQFLDELYEHSISLGNYLDECEYEKKIDWINNQAMRDKWDIHPDEE